MPPAAPTIAKRTRSLAEARRRSLQRRLSEDTTTKLAARGLDLEARAKYPTIQNDTCILSPDTIFGPYYVDGELYRRDIREGSDGIDLYLDIGLIDVDTCEPIEGAYIDFWVDSRVLSLLCSLFVLPLLYQHCNADGIYSGYTGIDPDTVEPYDGSS